MSRFMMCLQDWQDLGRIPVVQRGDTKLLSVVRRHDFVRAYARGLGRMQASSSDDGPLHLVERASQEPPK